MTWASSDINCHVAVRIFDKVDAKQALKKINQLVQLKTLILFSLSIQSSTNVLAEVGADGRS